MNKQDLAKLAEQFVSNATQTGQKDNLLIVLRGVSPAAQAIAEACQAHATKLGATSSIIERGSEYMNKLLENSKPDDLLRVGEDELKFMQQFTTNINIAEEHDLSKIKFDQNAYKKATRPSVDFRVNNTRWLVIRAPSPEFAAASNMALPAFEDFYKKVCLLDYTGMAKAVVPLKEMMDRSEHVRITGHGTDLQFSIKGLMSRPCVGERNIPDGECYTAPEKFSVNGRIQFGPSSYLGHNFSGIVLE